MSNGNNNLLMFAGLAISSLGMWYLYSNRNREMELEIKAMKSVKYTNIDNLISKSKNSEYLSTTNSSNSSYTSNFNNIGISNNQENSNLINVNHSINNNSTFERLDNDKEKDESMSKKGFFSNKYF